jgi:hypothetical protein
VISLINKITGKPVYEDEQGFLDNTGKFYNRKEALAYVLANGQFKSDKIRSAQLFSEDIW